MVAVNKYNLLEQNVVYNTAAYNYMLMFTSYFPNLHCHKTLTFHGAACKDPIINYNLQMLGNANYETHLLE